MKRANKFTKKTAVKKEQKLYSTSLISINHRKSPKVKTVNVTIQSTENGRVYVDSNVKFIGGIFFDSVCIHKNSS